MRMNVGRDQGRGRRAKSVYRTLGAVAAATAGLSGILTSAQGSTWSRPLSSGAGDWNTSGNWDAGIPSSSTVADISNGGIAQITTGTASALYFYLGNAAGQSGSLNISGGTFLPSSLAYIGYQGTGILNLSGGTLQTSGTVFVAEQGTGTINQTGGTLSVASSNLYVGFDGAGTYLLSSTGWMTAHEEIIGNQTAGTFLQSGGNNNQSNGTTVLGYSPGGSGYYGLNSGSFNSFELLVGNQGNGHFVQSGGTLNSAFGLLDLGVFSGAGTYELKSGAMSIGNCYVGTQGSGGSGGGTFLQSGGTGTETLLSIGPNGFYQLSGGTLIVNDLAPGSAGGGTLNLSGTATISYNGIADLSSINTLGGQNTTLIGGPTSLLLVPNGVNPATAFGSLSTTGFTHAMGSPLSIPQGKTVSGYGTLPDHLNLDGNASITTLTSGATISSTGSLSAAFLDVRDVTSSLAGFAHVFYLNIGDTGGTASLAQSAGSLNVGFATIGQKGRYQLSGGSSSMSVYSAGTFDFANAGGSLTLSGVSDLAGLGTASGTGTIVNASSAHVTLADHSLLILPAGFNPSTAFASLTLGGTNTVLHTVGSTLVIPQSVGISPSGFGGSIIDDFTDIAGSFSNSGGLWLKGGALIEATGSASLGIQGTLTVNNNFASGNSGGTLQMGEIGIGETGAGKFTQSGGTTNTVTAMDIGDQAAGSGTVALNGGTIEGTIHVGNFGNGTLLQSGGTIDSSATCDIGQNPGSAGTYSISTGWGPQNLNVGNQGNGTFSQSGGQVGVSFSNLNVGSQVGGRGTYLMNDGTCTQGGIFLGQDGSGTFNQSGGTVTCQGFVFLGGDVTGSGTYLLSAGTLLGQGTMYLGANGTGYFKQTGGTASFGGIEVAADNVATASGTLDLRGGNLSATKIEVGTLTNGPGYLLQSGGSLSASSTINVYGHGTYSLSGGTLTASGIGLQGGTMNVAKGYAGVVKASVLYIDPVAGGRLDLADAPADFSNATQLSSVRGWLQSGYANGSWNGNTGIVSSVAAAENAKGVRTALAYSRASDDSITKVRGMAVSPSDTVILYTLSGDANMDGSVNSSDFALLAAEYGGTAKTWINGDFNYDGTVNALDFNALASNYGDNITSISSEPAFSSVLVPEPILGCALLGGLLLRRRSNHPLANRIL